MPESIIRSRVTKYTTFGGYLRAAREYLDYTQGELAKRVGISRTTINELEQGKSLPGLATFLLLVNYLEEEGAPKINIAAIEV